MISAIFNPGVGTVDIGDLEISHFAMMDDWLTV
jgi:hypothetical protein